MEPFEIMTSESQERMLAIVEPDALDEVLTICRRWEVRAAVVGRVTEGGSLRILDRAGEVLGEVPAASLHEDAPVYDRPLLARDRGGELDPATVEPPPDAGPELLDLLADPGWVWHQYDHQLFLNTVAGPGGDATVLRLKHPLSGEDTGRALALTTDGNHRWCAVSPRVGTARVVAEAVLNLACVGARPLALVNCCNFGNPEHPEVMWELSEAIDGMTAACRSFDLPVVGGNVSLYNETRGSDIEPTPIVGVLGVVDALVRRPPGPALAAGGQVLVLGGESTASLAGSRWAWQRGCKGGHLDALDLEAVGRLAALVRTLVADDALRGVHDVADGGLALALAEMVAISVHGLPDRAGRPPVPVRRGPRSGGGVRRARPDPRGDGARGISWGRARESWAGPEAIASCSARSWIWPSPTWSPPGRIACRPPSAPPPATEGQAQELRAPRTHASRLRSLDGADEQDGLGRFG